MMLTSLVVEKHYLAHDSLKRLAGGKGVELPNFVQGSLGTPWLYLLHLGKDMQVGSASLKRPTLSKRWALMIRYQPAISIPYHGRSKLTPICREYIPFGVSQHKCNASSASHAYTA
jgi:hypothetical protein